MADDSQIDLVLRHVNDPEYGKIWLFSSESLAKVPELYNIVQINEVESRLPEQLVKTVFLGVPLWQWLAVILLIPVTAVAAWCVIQIFRLIVALVVSARRPHFKYKFTWTVSIPALVLFMAILHRVFLEFLGLPLLFRHYSTLVWRVVVISAATWLAIRITANLVRRLRTRAIHSGRTGVGSVLLLGQRILKIFLIIAGAIGVLSSLGFNMTTALAGLGITGLAVAFAAQKTLENVFGGLSVLGDETIRVGDKCRFGTTIGIVEDIGLRSTRIRTEEEVSLSIPNGVLASMNLENLSYRQKMLIHTTLSLRSETTHDQLLVVLAETRRLLYAHPKVEIGTSRCRLTGFENNAINFEIVCYIKTNDRPTFAEIQEDLLLRIMEIVENCGTGFAIPLQRIFMAHDHALDPQKSAEAARTVSQWRERRIFPFPDFPPSEITRLRGAISYPEPESAAASRDNNAI